MESSERREREQKIKISGPLNFQCWNMVFPFFFSFKKDVEHFQWMLNLSELGLLNQTIQRGLLVAILCISIDFVICIDSEIITLTKSIFRWI